MVAKNTLDGLIVTTREEASAALTELSAAFGWPTLWAATARQMLRELSLEIPACVLFWLDDWDSIAATARLIEWLRERDAGPFRVAVACDLGDGAEAVLRAAGAHSVLPVTGQSGAAIALALASLLQTVAVPVSLLAASERASPIEMPADLVRPP
jgi:hypothetical protein